MQRVRHNIEVLLPRLEACGYEFGYEWMSELPQADLDWIALQPAPYTPPPEEITTSIERFEEMAGPLPLSLKAFYSEVGGVNFVGRHPIWEEYFREYTPRGLEPVNPDPLFVWVLFEETFHDYASWQKSTLNQDIEAKPYLLPIAGDAYLKYNISGAGAYEMALPNLSADALLLNEWHHTTFVNYLRICLHYGGLPGLQRIENVIPDELAYLRKDLLPI
jgi:hypothetical protein